jgi:hypothetical protein
MLPAAADDVVEWMNTRLAEVPVPRVPDEQ